MEKPARILELDGLRGFAAVLVVIAHYFGEVAGGLENLRFGWFGVEVFFVLSGFLIGGIILDERGRDGFWRSFYVRRSARIVPIYLTVLGAVALMTAVFAWAEPMFPAWTYLTFTQNLYAAVNGADALWLQPLWTLAVEEQFYLVLPLLIVLLPRKALPWTLLAMIALAPVYRYLTLPLGHGVSTLLLPGRMDLLAAGVLVAWAVRNLNLKPFLMALRIAPIPLLVACPTLFLLTDLTTFATWGQGLVAAAVGSFIAALVLGAPEGRGFLTLPVMRFFGLISYGLYLIHQPVNVAFHGIAFGQGPALGTSAQLLVTIAAFAVSILLAWGSWFLLEKPVIGSARRWLNRKPAPALIPAVA
jgi:peptidoglycan/LPS O-acetylase OafA/YrhL